MPGDLERARHVLKNFGDILAHLAHLRAAIRAGAGRLVHLVLARQVIGQGFAEGLLGLSLRMSRIILRELGFAGRSLLLQVVELQLQLLDLAIDPLGRRSELHALQPCDLQLELLDGDGLRLHRSGELAHQRLQRVGVVRQVREIDPHACKTTATLTDPRLRILPRVNLSP